MIFNFLWNLFKIELHDNYDNYENKIINDIQKRFNKKNVLDYGDSFLVINYFKKRYNVRITDIYFSESLQGFYYYIDNGNLGYHDFDDSLKNIKDLFYDIKKNIILDVIIANRNEKLESILK